VTSTVSVGLIIGNIPLEVDDNVFSDVRKADDNIGTDNQLLDTTRNLTKKLKGKQHPPPKIAKKCLQSSFANNAMTVY
jgi:hypothetical protein